MSLFNSGAWQNFSRSFNTLLYILLVNTKKRNVFQDSKNTLYFNWGLIWNTLSPLILVIGLSILVTSGIRGRGFSLEYIVFLLMHWFAFIGIVHTVISFKPDANLLSKRFISPWLICLVSFFISIIQLSIRFIIVYVVMTYMGFVLQPFHLISNMLLLSSFALFYGIIISTLLHEKDFLQDLHGYFLSGLFFISSIIIPITRVPESVREVLLYNPLVHLNEWTKTATSGISYSYIDIGYFLNSFYFLLILFPIFLYLKNNLCLIIKK